MKRKSKGQSLTEYSIFLGIILIAVIGINIYVKRGLQARYRDMVDQTTSAASPKKQYEPYYAASTRSMDVNATTSETTSGITADRKIINPGKVIRSFSGQPTTVSSNDNEQAGMIGTEVDNGNKITKVE